MNTKQVIVLRKDLNMRKGKMVAQGSHASLSAFLKADQALQDAWWSSGQTKICVSVNSEEELHKILEQAIDAGIPAFLVKDKGLTEFNEPTYTAVAIGPDYAEKIDPITGKLTLL